MRSRQVAETYGLAAPALWNSNTFVEKRTIRRGTAILAVGPAGILPADKCTKATGKMPIFPTPKMAEPPKLRAFQQC